MQMTVGIINLKIEFSCIMLITGEVTSANVGQYLKILAF
jgi:hypothetical protein